MADSTNYAVSLTINARQRVAAATEGVRSRFRGLRQEANVTSRVLGLPKVRADIGRFGEQMVKVREPARRLAGTVRGLAGNLSVLGGGLAAYAINATLDAAITRADQLAKTADRFGLGIERLQTLRFAAVREGADEQSLDDGLRDLSKNIGEAVNGTGEATEVFKALGIQLTDTGGRVRATDDVLIDIADRLQRVEGHSVRVAVVQKLMGESGGRLTNLLAKGSDALREYEREARTLGLTTERQARLAEKLADRQANLGRAFEGLGGSILESVAPVMFPFLQSLQELVTTQREVIASSIAGVVAELAAGLSAVNWVGVIDSVRGFAAGVRETVEFMGGWQRSLVIVAAVLHADLVVSLLRASVALGRIAVSAGLAAARLGILVAGAMIGQVVSFVTALKYGVGVVRALNIAIASNPVGFVLTMMTTAAAAIIYNWDAIKQWFEELDLFGPVRRRIASFLETLPGFVRQALNITDQDIASVRGGPADEKKTVKASTAPVLKGAPTLPERPDLPSPSAGLEAGLPSSIANGLSGGGAGGAGFSAGAASAAVSGETRVVVVFENAPAGLRVGSRESSPGVALDIEVDQGRSLAAAG